MGFAVIDRYQMILNRIGVFWLEHSLQAGVAGSKPAPPTSENR
jgi:hypothetical protein